MFPKRGVSKRLLLETTDYTDYTDAFSRVLTRLKARGFMGETAKNEPRSAAMAALRICVICVICGIKSTLMGNRANCKTIIGMHVDMNTLALATPLAARKCGFEPLP